MPFVLLQLLLRQRKGLFADQGGNGNLDPVLVRSFVIGAIAAGEPVALPQRSRDSLAWTKLGLAITCPASVRRVPEQPPDRRPFPARRLRPGWNLTFVEHAGNCVDAETLLRVYLIHLAYHRGFGLDNFVECRCGDALFHIAIAVRGAR